MRNTRHRQQILNLFDENSTLLLSADDVFERIGSDNINLSTVYRNINALHEHNRLKKCILNSTAYYYASLAGHHHIAICTECKSFISIGCFVDTMIADSMADSSFEVTDHELTLFGTCESCQKHKGA